MSIHSLSVEEDYLFLKVKKFAPYLGIRTLIGQMVKSVFSVDISKFSNSSFSKTTALNSSVKFIIDGVILLEDTQMEKALILFSKLEKICAENAKES